MKYLLLFHHFKAFYQFPKHIIVLVKIVANASLRNVGRHQITEAVNRRRTDNIIDKRRRTDNIIDKRRTDNIIDKRRRTDNIIDKRRRTDNDLQNTT